MALCCRHRRGIGIGFTDRWRIPDGRAAGSDVSSSPHHVVQSAGDAGFPLLGAMGLYYLGWEVCGGILTSAGIACVRTRAGKHRSTRIMSAPLYFAQFDRDEPRAMRAQRSNELIRSRCRCRTIPSTKCAGAGFASIPSRERTSGLD